MGFLSEIRLDHPFVPADLFGCAFGDLLAAVEHGQPVAQLHRDLHVLLDESFSGLSHKEAASLVELVRELRRDGMTILLIEHNMQIRMQLCDRLAVLDRGEKIAEGTPEEIRRNKRVIEAYLGQEAHA